MKIIPAILTDNITDLENNLAKIQGLTDWVQIDIMDSTLVDNTSISLEDLSASQVAKEFSLEAHLMVKTPAQYFEACQKANVKRVVFHIEAGDTENILSKAHGFDFQKALAINPKTPVEQIKPYLHQIDVAVLMSVEPGRQGQTFIGQTIDKIKEFKALAPELKIEVDGGVNVDNIGAVAEAGADYIVVGSGLFGAGNIKERFNQLQNYV